MENKKNVIVLYVFLVLLFIIVTIGLTYAYFAALITNESIKSSGSSAKVAITFSSDSNNGVIVGEKILPGWSDVKKFTITGENTNNSNFNLEYDLFLVILNNEFNDGGMVYDLSGNGYDISDIVIPYSESTRREISLIPDGEVRPFFAPGSEVVTHSYTLTVRYKNLSDVPQYIEGQQLSAYVVVKSSTEMTRN